ncbi:MAG: transcriptional regulator, AraC family [Segetibacter sp.]|nr:transcriptional regulator, AraC family [Segetibacter sp.]
MANFELQIQYVMNEIVKLESVAQYNAMRGAATLNPLVTVLDLSTVKPMPARTFNFGLYAVYLKELKCGELKYGRNHYDYQEGTLVFIGPGQVLGVQPKVTTFEAKGWALLFHPDLIKGTPLGKHIQDYSFFSYDIHEALHISEQERQVVLECFRKIDFELKHAIDKHSKKLIVSNIELFLNYCVRYYDRQFITRDHINTGVLEKFETLLHNYFHSEKPQEIGIPSVGFFANELNLSANYFGDLVKKETGKTAQEYIQAKLIDVAKEKIFDPSKTVSEIAYELGFKYPQHFTRLFKQQLGYTPNEYRGSLN